VSGVRSPVHMLFTSASDVRAAVLTSWVR